jgi:hypothetical protein
LFAAILEARQRSASIRWLHVGLPSSPNPQNDRYGDDAANWSSQQAHERRDPWPHSLLASGRFVQVGVVPGDQEWRSGRHSAEDEREKADQNGFPHPVIVAALPADCPQH